MVGISSTEPERTGTGIPGLDEMLNGGIPKGVVCVVSGGPGCGKTVFSRQFLYEGAVRYGEPGIYVSLGETRDEFFFNARIMGMDFEKLERENLFSFLDMGYEKLISPYVESYGENSHNYGERYGDDGMVDPYIEEIYSGFLNTLSESITSLSAKRVVIDPINSLILIFENELRLRREILRIFTILKEYGCTTLVISERNEEKGRYSIEDFIAQGVIRMGISFRNDIMHRYMIIHKMRATAFTERVLSFKITDKGIRIIGENLYNL